MRSGTFVCCLFLHSICFAAEIVPNAPFSKSEWQKCDAYLKRRRASLFSEEAQVVLQKKELPCPIAIDHLKKELYLHLKGRKGAFIGQGCNKVITKSILYGIKPRLVARCEGDLTVLEEGRILSLFSGIPGIVQIYSSMKSSADTGEIMLEYFNCGSLKDLQKRKLPLPEQSIRSIIQDLLTGLKAIHDKGYYHRDLHRGNILLNRRGDTIKAAIADFGLAMPIDVEPDAIIAVPDSSCPPETIFKPLREIDRKKSEAYSMGVIMHILLFKTMPEWSRSIRQSELPQLSQTKKIALHHSITEMYSKRIPSLKKNKAHIVREKLIRITFQMLHPNPKKRISVEEALNYVLSL